jgi:hypothetical protein
MRFLLPGVVVFIILDVGHYQAIDCIQTAFGFVHKSDQGFPFLFFVAANREAGIQGPANGPVRHKIRVLVRYIYYLAF